MTDFKLPKLEGDVCLGQHIIYFSCDPKYWENHGIYLVKSTAHYNPHISIHVHILFNNKEVTINKFIGKNNNITYSYEFVTDKFLKTLKLSSNDYYKKRSHTLLNTNSEKIIKQKIYFASARFIRMKELFSDYQYVLQLDADGLCRKKFTIDDFEKITNSPSAMRKPKDPSTLIASCITPGTGKEGSKFKTDLTEQMTKTFAGEIYWFIDQVVLKKVFSKFKFESIPYHWNAWGFKPADIFSTAKGKKKNNWRYLDVRANWLDKKARKEYILNCTEDRKRNLLNK
jgi:hypothetical protein|tara:strand:- start:16383 stop:17237 length:855 start_codon:yes stop_codon:yes gene_type:complete